MAAFLLSKYPGVESVAGSYGKRIFNCVRNDQTVSEAAIPLHSPMSRTWEHREVHIPPRRGGVGLFRYSYSSRCVVIWPGAFNLHLSHDWYIERDFMCSLIICAPCFGTAVLKPLTYSYMCIIHSRLLIVLKTLDTILYQICVLQIIVSTLWLAFSFS